MGNGLTPDDITDRVVSIIKEQLNLDEDADISTKSSIEGDLFADSLDMVEIVCAIEDEFNIHIQDIQADRIDTIQDVIDIVLKELNG